MLLQAAPLTPSGRPVLQPGEVEVSLLDKVDLEFHPTGGLVGQTAEAYKDGYAILTTRQLIWVGASNGGGGGGGGGPPRAVALPLAAVAACAKKVQYSLKGPKVRLQLEVYSDAQRQPVAASGFHTNIGLLGLRCRGPAPDAFKSLLDDNVRQAVAADAAAAAAAPPAPAAQAPPRLVNAAAAGYGPLGSALQARNSPRPANGSPAPPAAAAPAAGRSPPPPSPPQQQTPRPDPVMLQAMVDMGFPRNRCARSLLATRNEGVQEALDYMLAFGDQPGMDDPLDQPLTATTPTAAAPTATGGPYQQYQQPQPPAAAERYPTILYPPPQPPQPQQPSQPYPPPPPHPYGPAMMYGGAAGAAYHPPYGAEAAAPDGQLVDGLQHLSLRPQLHQPSSAPELAGMAARGGGAGGSGGSGGMPSSSSASAIGVAGIVKREQQKTAESGRAVEQAFRDLSALMSSAATMVALAEKFRGVMATADGGGGGGGSGGEDPLLLDLDTQQQLIALGISSPVTRETAGARYHTELSRQLADFLAGPLQRCGGLISLPDVYCLFNRARGTELVSPDDLLQAAKQFARAGVPGLRLRPLSSGVLVIQGPQHSEEQVCAKIAELTRPSPATAQPASPVAAAASTRPAAAPPPPPLGPGLTAGDVARALGGISLAIATEHLLTAEARGVVCRDDGPEGLRFYRNFFRQDGPWLALAGG